VAIEKAVLKKLHVPALAIAVFGQLRVVATRLFDTNYLSLTPFVKADITIAPSIVDPPYAAYSLDLVLARARALDGQGRKAQWHLKGGPERDQATKHYDRAVRIAALLYKKTSLQYAEVALEFAKHLESIHEEQGSPLNSKWNRAAQILPSKHSELAQYFYTDAHQVYESLGYHSKQVIECLLGLGRLCAVLDV
jgi:hypothetical protein